MAAQFPLLLPASKLPPKLVVFDLDKTLIAGDSTILWTEWLYEKGLVKDPIWFSIVGLCTKFRGKIPIKIIGAKSGKTGIDYFVL